MKDDSKRVPKWQSMSEGGESLPTRPTTRRAVLPKAPSGSEHAQRKKKLLLMNGALIAAALVLLGVLLVRPGSPPSTPPEPVAENIPEVKPKPAAPRPAAASPRPKTFRDRMKNVVDLESASPKAFKELHEAWTALLSDPESRPYESTIREQIERLETAAHKEYREVYRATYDRVKELLGAHQAREALATLQAWKVPESLDIGGVHAAELKKEIASVGELVAFEAVREKLLSEFRANSFAQDPESALAPYFKSSHFSVRNEAERLLPELRVMKSLDVLRRKAQARRAEATARVDDIRRQIAEDAKLEQGRLKAWEARLREATTKKPIPIRALGADMEEMVRVQKYDGKEVAFAGKGFEIRLGVDEIPAALYAQLLQSAPDPSDARDLLEAGKLAVRRGALEAAQALFAQALKADRAIAGVLPDLERIRRGTARLHVPAAVTGDHLVLAYGFQSSEEANDFQPSAETKVTTGGGSLMLSGKKLFCVEVGDIKFQDRLKIALEPVAANGSVGYILGTIFEAAPGEEEYLVAVVEPDRGFQVARITHKGSVDSLGEGRVPNSLGAVEMSFTREAVELHIAGAVRWTGQRLTSGLLRPILGGNDFSDAGGQVRYKSLRLEGRISPVWVQRLQSERLTVIEAELAKDRRTTKEEREAKPADKEREFGEMPVKAIPLEAELRPIIPGKVAGAYWNIRHTLERMEKAKTIEAWQLLEHEVDTLFDQALGEAPWFPLTYYYRAEWEQYRGQATRALADLGEAVRRQEGFVEARLARAELLLAESKYDEVAKEVDAALAAVPDLAPARLLRALLHYYGGREADAVQELELARRLEPGNVTLRRSAKRLRNIVTGPRWSDSVTLETPGYTIKAEVAKLPKKGKKDDAQKVVRERTQEYADHLNAARRWFAEFVPGRAGVVPRKPLIYIFDSPESYYVYADFTQEDRLEHTAGVYFPLYQQLLFFRDETEAETLATMTHEAFHEYLVAMIPGLPTWANEGMAEYASGIAVRGGKVVETGRVLRGRLQDLQKALKLGWQGVPFDLMMAESKEMFYSVLPELQYAQAWSMIHFFMHAQEGRYKPALDLYLLSLSKGNLPDEALKESFGKTNLVEMRREWSDYVRGLK